RDLERSLEFDQSQLFRKIYSEEFGTPGGEPFGVLLGDFEIHRQPGPGHPTDDLGTLASIAPVAAAAFCPFLAAAHPSLFDLESFADLERPLNLPRTFEQVEYIKWRALRQTEDARFAGLLVPRVLARLPYADRGSRVDNFRFREEPGDPDRGGYLWGNAVYAFGAVLIRAFADSGWFAQIRGVPTGAPAGGLVTGLPAPSVATDRPGIVAHSSTEVMITDALEKEISELGFIALCHCPDTHVAAFYSNPSIQQPKVYDEAVATANARLSAMLQYMMCVSRFAHYLKVLARDKVGSFIHAADCQDFLQRWLLDYVQSTGKEAAQAQYP